MLFSPLHQLADRAGYAQHNSPASFTCNCEGSNRDAQQFLLSAVIFPKIGRFPEKQAERQHAGILSDCLLPHRLVFVIIELKTPELLQKVQALRVFQHESRE